MHNITQCIKEHQANAQQTRSIDTISKNNDMNDLKAKYEGLLQVIDEFKNGIKDTYITTSDVTFVGNKLNVGMGGLTNLVV